MFRPFLGVKLWLSFALLPHKSSHVGVTYLSNKRTYLVHIQLSSLLGSGPLLLDSIELLFPLRSFLLHLALDSSIQVVEKVITHLLRGRLVLDGP